jgi:shikimate dehydrogenase
VKPLHLALFGKPVSHSLSPGIHESFGRQFELNVDYRLIEAGPNEFPGALDQFRSEGGSGCNITLPLKTEAYRLAQVKSRRAELASAANTLWWDAEGRLRADNTDGTGLVRDIESNLGISIRSRRLLVLGAGGSCAGIMAALLDQEPEQVIIANRTGEKAVELAQRHASLGEVRGIALETLADERADIVIDTTSAGHEGKRPAIRDSVLEAAGLCYSLNYGEAANPMRNWCLELGVPFQDGLGMLVEQAARAFEIWTGFTPQTESVYKDLDFATK